MTDGRQALEIDHVLTSAHPGPLAHLKSGGVSATSGTLTAEVRQNRDVEFYPPALQKGVRYETLGG